MTSDYIIFTIAQRDYALDVSNIERIDQIPALTPISNSHAFVDGMMMYQNHTLKVINFRKMSNTCGEEPPIASQKLLIYRDKNGLFAIKVDTIKDITAFDDSSIKTYSHTVSVGQHLFTRGVVEYKKTLVVVIDSVTLPIEEVV